MRGITLLAVLWSALYGCGERALSLYVIDCGRIRFETPTPFGVAASETDARELSVPCYLVDHPDGTLLWEAGMPTALAGRGWVDPPPQTIAAPGVQVRLDRPLSESLAELGMDLASIDFVAFSHMHFDHVGTVNELGNGRFLVARAEFDAAFADSVTVPLFNPDYYADLRASDHVLLDSEHDVFGDGRVRILPAPGHTPGHQVLLVDLEETGPILLAGDLYFFDVSREWQRVPLFNVNRDQTLQSMEGIEAMVEEAGAQLWIEHDSRHFDTLLKAPAFYR